MNLLKKFQTLLNDMQPPKKREYIIFYEACSTSNDVDRMDCLSVLPQDFCDELNRQPTSSPEAEE